MIKTLFMLRTIAPPLPPSIILLTVSIPAEGTARQSRRGANKDSGTPFHLKNRGYK